MTTFLVCLKVFVIIFAWPIMAIDKGIDAIYKAEHEQLERCMQDPKREECK